MNKRCNHSFIQVTYLVIGSGDTAVNKIDIHIWVHEQKLNGEQENVKIRPQGVAVL